MREGLKVKVSGSDKKRVAMPAVDRKQRDETDFTEMQVTVLVRRAASWILRQNGRILTRQYKEVRGSARDNEVRGEVYGSRGYSGVDKRTRVSWHLSSRADLRWSARHWTKLEGR